MDLKGWQERLEGHFRALRERRSATVGDRSLFALEHGIESGDLHTLETEIRAHIRRHPPSREHRLPWIVYAAEIGYRYSGYEYWQTFEKETPGWPEHGKRTWIRSCFQEFHRTYGGAEPSGPWAENFTIICWPIAHAILPKDLQRQLAQVLYELRHSFHSELFDAPETLGELIAARSWQASSRFQNLTQQPMLLGQIAAALLVEDPGGSRSLILPSTLRRIAEDLEQERLARDWLQSARRIAERAQLRGLRSTSGLLSHGKRRDPDEPSQQLRIEPRLVLRPTPAGSWHLLAEIPDLSPLLARLPSSRNVLTKSRCVVNGSGGSPLWRGRLLQGHQRVRLRQWPMPKEPLLFFEQSTPELDYLLRTACHLRPGPTWLFRIASDGLAYELRTMTVRPGRRYIVLTTDSSLPSLKDCPAVNIECGGVTALQVDPPESFTDEWLAGLQAAGINPSRTLEVWPAGLSAASWDDDGRAEWLTSDEVCLGIRADYPIEDITVDVDGSPLVVKPFRSGDTTFVDLGHLPVGRQELRIAARARKGDQFIESTGYLDLTVREPRPWLPGVIPQGPLMVFLDPGSPTLEDLWEGRLSIEIHGPAKRTIQCTVALFDRSEPAPQVPKTLPSIPLPVSREAWQSQLEKLRNDKRVRAAYDFTQYCVVKLSAAELGSFSFRAEREFTPLRWAVSRTEVSHQLTLLDDRGVEDAVEVEFYGFELPDEPTSLPRFSGTLVADESGGMYVAKSQDTTRAIIVPPIVKRLEDLGVRAHVRTRRRRSSDDLYLALSNVWLWSDARLTGEILIAVTRQRAVLSFLATEAFSVIGGERWAQAEASFGRSGSPEALIELKRAISAKPPEAGLGAKLMMEYELHSSLAPRDRAERLGTLIAEFLDLPARLRGERQSAETPPPTNPAWLSEFALRLASCSRGTNSWAAQHVRQGLSSLLDCPAIARAARFLVLAIEASRTPTAIAAGELYQGWEWS